MAHPYHHSLSSVKKWGGKWQDYIKVHNWFDQSKAHMADGRHRALLHSSFGIFICEQVFGTVLKRESDGKEIPIRWIGEQHVIEDMGKIPSAQDYLNEMELKNWMVVRARRLSEEIINEPIPETYQE